MRLIRDKSAPFSVWVNEVQGRRTRRYCSLLRDNSRPLLSASCLIAGHTSAPTT